jgi:hypothetical protein
MNSETITIGPETFTRDELLRNYTIEDDPDYPIDDDVRHRIENECINTEIDIMEPSTDEKIDVHQSNLICLIHHAINLYGSHQICQDFEVDFLNIYLDEEYIEPWRLSSFVTTELGFLRNENRAIYNDIHRLCLMGPEQFYQDASFSRYLERFYFN